MNELAADECAVGVDDGEVGGAMLRREGGADQLRAPLRADAVPAALGPVVLVVSGPVQQRKGRRDGAGVADAQLTALDRGWSESRERIGSAEDAVGEDL